MSARATRATDRRVGHLGDMLQRLADISPNDVYAISLIVQDALIRAEREHDTRRRQGLRNAPLKPKDGAQ